MSTGVRGAQSGEGQIGGFFLRADAGTCRTTVVSTVAAAESAEAERECDEICRQLQESEQLAQEAWEREMGAVLERVRAADSAVFRVMVAVEPRANYCGARRLVHHAAWYGSRAVLEEGCARTPDGPAEAAQMLDGEGSLLLHLVMLNKHLSAKDIWWVLSLHAAAAGAANLYGQFPLHMLLRNHDSLTVKLVDAVIEAYPPAALHAVGSKADLPLHSACSNPCIPAPVLRHLLSLDTAAAGTADSHGEYPLHLFVRSHSSPTPELVDMLLEAHPQALQTADRGSHLPLHCACSNPHMSASTLRHLVSLHSAAAGAVQSSGSVPLHLVVGNHRSLVPELVEVLLEAHSQAPQTADRQNHLPLHRACMNPHMTASALRHLVALYPAAAEVANQQGYFPLHLLVTYHESLTPDLVDTVMEAHPQALQFTGAQFNLPLHCACRNPYMTAPALRHLVSLHTAAAGAVDFSGSFPLHLLVGGHKSLTPELVDVLLEAHPQAVQTADRGNNLPLHRACINPCLTERMLRHLLSLDAAAAGTADSFGGFPLHLLVGKHESLTPELVGVLLEAHPQALQTVDRRSHLPLHRACTNAHMTASALRYLVSLHPAAAGTVSNRQAYLPLHLLVEGHSSLTPELMDVLLQAHPQALQTADQEKNLPLHSACSNPCMTAPALRHLRSLDAAAAGTANQNGELPLHKLLLNHKSLSPDLVATFVETQPQVLRTADWRGRFPLHCASSNCRMTADGLGAVLLPFPDAAAISDSTGRLPYYHITGLTPSTVRIQLCKMLMEATDSLFPYQGPGSHAGTSSSLSGPRYVPPPPDPRWASRPHPLSRQGRLKAGLHVAVRGRESVWQFQTGGGPQPGRAVVDDMRLADMVCAGHRSLVRQWLARSSAAVDLDGVVEAVLCALELGHTDVVRSLLTDGSSAVQISCSPTQACEWLGALMRHRHVDYGWLVEWMDGQRSVWGGVDPERVCLGAAALSGDLALVESMASAWQTRSESLSATKDARKELGGRAVAGGSVAVLRWLQAAGLAVIPSRHGLKSLSTSRVAKHDRLEMMELLYKEGRWWPDDGAVRGAVEGGNLRVLRWLHARFHDSVRAGGMATAIRHGHAAVVHFLHRHRNITRASRDNVLAEAVKRSAPGTLGVVQYVLQHNLCGDAAVTREVVVNACTATTVRVDVVRYLVSCVSEEVLRFVEEDLAGSGGRQAQDVFRAARLWHPQW